MDAIDDLSDAIDVTRNLLIPVRKWLWLKLAIVVFFVGGVGSGGFGGGGAPPDTGTDPAEQPPTDTAVESLPDEIFLYLLIAAVVLVLLWLVFRLISAIMEFVFVDTLRSHELQILSSSREQAGRGVRLFLFRLGALFVLSLVIGIPVALALLGTSSPETALGSLLLILLFGLFVLLLYSIVMRFTSEFVAPIMLLESRGVIGGWKRFWGTFRANWSEYVVYLLLVWILQLVVGIAASFLVLFAVIVVAIPFVIVGGLLVVGLGDIGVWLAIPVGILGLLAIVLTMAVIQMPIRTYFQYYALLLLGDTNAELDLIPDQRETVRQDDTRDEYDGRDGRDLPPDERDGDDQVPGSDDRSSDDDAVWDDDDTDTWEDRDDWGSSSREDGSTDTDDWDDRDGGDDRDDSDDDRGW